MHKFSVIALFCLFFSLPGMGQQASRPQDYPQDYLSPEFHQERRELLRKKLPENSVAVFFANPIRNRANDVDYLYHQDPDFYYLTGLMEPNASLLIFSEPQTTANGETYDEVIFVQGHNERQELYNGPRLGPEGAQQQLGFQHAYENTAFKDFEVMFPSFSKVLFFEFQDDIRDIRNEEGDLYDMVRQFKHKAEYPMDFNAYRETLYEEIRNSSPENRERLKRQISYLLRSYPELAEDKVISGFISDASQIEQQKFVASIPPPSSNLDALMLPGLMADLREIKTPAEIKLLRKAVDISSIGQVEVMKAMHPNMSEAEVQGIHEFVFKKYGAEFEGYPSIVGAGHNGCVLHYIQNNKLQLGNELVLMDLGAEYRGYTADVTRTIPANGRFTKEQKAIYDLVYQAQEEAFKICKPGEPIRKTTEVSMQVIAKGLMKLGIISNEQEARKYFPHGVSHHIGLDVHDRGNYQHFEENMVLTVEPGIYIPENSPCDKKWWGIAVRIEDDILITKDGYELLSAKAPRTSSEIEKLMKQKSVLTDFLLPELD